MKNKYENKDKSKFKLIHYTVFYDREMFTIHTTQAISSAVSPFSFRKKMCQIWNESFMSSL